MPGDVARRAPPLGGVARLPAFGGAEYAREPGARFGHRRGEGAEVDYVNPDALNANTPFPRVHQVLTPGLPSGDL